MTNEFNTAYRDMARMPPGKDKAMQYLASALLCHGEAHHMTWCIEQAIEALGVPIAHVRERLAEMGYDWEEGTPP